MAALQSKIISIIVSVNSKKSLWLIIICEFHFLPAQITLPFTLDFEISEGYSLGDLDGQNGWILNQGQATIISGNAFSGDNLASLIANNPYSQVSYLFSSIAGDEISFVDFYIKPKVGDILNIEEVVDSEGVLIGFINTGSVGLVVTTKTETLEKLVWETRKDSDNERQKLHDRREDTDAEPGGQRENDPGSMPGEQPKRTDLPPLET